MECLDGFQCSRNTFKRVRDEVVDWKFASQVPFHQHRDSIPSLPACMYVCTRMDGCMDVRMDGWMDGGMEGWRDGGMEGWRDGGVEGWRDG